jgi:uncharacterized Tic20 family protein
MAGWSMTGGRDHPTRPDRGAQAGLHVERWPTLNGAVVSPQGLYPHLRRQDRRSRRSPYSCAVASTPPQPGWYPDPGGSAAHRYWDGTRWTDALSSAIPPAGPTNARDDRRTWALVAHLSPLPSMMIAMAFIGPLIVYAMKKDDPSVRRHAAEALNFQLSVLLYALVLGLAAIVGLAFGAAALLVVVPLGITLAVAWFVLICVAAVKAGDGEAYRYPLTIRFVQ